VPSEVLHDSTEGRFSLEGRKEGGAIAANIDVGTPMEGLRDNKSLEPGDVDYAGGQAGPQHWMGGTIETELAVFEEAGIWNLVDVPGEAVLEASNRIHHTKEDEIERDRA